MGTALLLASCSSTIAGTPVADPSAVPKPDVGSFPTAPRTVGSLTDSQARAAEGYRMAEIIPMPPDVDPSQRYNGSISVGKPSLGLSFGEGVGSALKDMEVGAYSSAQSTKPGVSTFDTPGTSLLMGFARMKDAAAATAAVSDPAILAAEKPQFSTSEPAKEQVAIPGYSAAKAYRMTWPSTKTVSIVAVLASDRYVLFTYTTMTADAVKKFFDLQTKALGGFTPTPVDRFSTLTKDRDDLLKYTLAGEGNRDVVLPARTAVVNQSDITGSVKNFADAGVDVVARAGNTVYRAKDAAGARLLADAFVAELKGFYAGNTASTVKGVPGGQCLTYPPYKGSKDSRSYCVAPVGRYLVEVSGTQLEKTKQAVGASYLVLQGAK
ncbi:DUF7373 family lipoprotein [Tsukamurella pseudospumae]|uniref:DUF7373 family lipoprotein n=1 Tax=Tsukamurella pseudospumae TaxID=239498 RepID=UPI001111C988|nr:hypothetical protein [Tsukamurella pseudospumae]